MPAPPQPLPPKKPVLKREGFTIKDGVITCNGHERVDGPTLETLFHPEQLPAPRNQKRAEEKAKKLFSRPFFSAQLRYYGITFPKSATEAQLKSLLDKAVIARQCAQVPASILRVHQELRLDYNRELQAWQKVVDNWDEECRRRLEEAWAQLETPGDRAAHDLDRFMEHYFLTDGQPDPAKKPEPLALYGLTDVQIISDIYERIVAVPSLNIIHAGQDADSAICIGWDHFAVCGLAADVESLAREKQRKAAHEEWEKAMETHHRLVEAAAEQLSEFVSSPPNKSCALKAARGSFILQCKAIAELYPDYPSVVNLSLDIADSLANNSETLRAAVNLGVFQGTAILSFSHDVINWFVRHYDKTAQAAAARNNSTSSSDASRGKRKADSVADGERPTKQRKPDEPASHGRIILRMRGRELIGGNICEDVQHGYLDFTDNACTKFKGVIDIPGVGEDLEVEGFRVSNHAVVEPPPWSWFWPGAEAPSSSIVPEGSDEIRF